jgi:hypothetical protein
MLLIGKQHVQDLEEDRLALVKDIVWAYANAVSQVCVEDDSVSRRTDSSESDLLARDVTPVLILTVLRAHSGEARAV